MTGFAELDEDRCRELLASADVGRVGLCTSEGPYVLPVNYALVDEAIVFRTSPYSVLGSHAWGTRLAFEVDGLDHDRRVGWSVLARGHAEMIDDEQDLADVRALGDPTPWAPGQRILYVRLAWEELTGRTVGPA